MSRRSSNQRSRGRSIVASAAGLACALALVVTPASAAPERESDRRDGALPILTGRVGPGFKIKLDQDSIPAGRYKVIIRDLSTIHNFHLKGMGVDRWTEVPGRGKVKWRVTLTAGTYRAFCDPHPSMEKTLTVT
jgi:hypothetical protein